MFQLSGVYFSSSAERIPSNLYIILQGILTMAHAPLLFLGPLEVTECSRFDSRSSPAIGPSWQLSMDWLEVVFLIFVFWKFVHHVWEYSRKELCHSLSTEEVGVI